MVRPMTVAAKIDRAQEELAAHPAADDAGQ